MTQQLLSVRSANLQNTFFSFFRKPILCKDGMHWVFSCSCNYQNMSYVSSFYVRSMQSFDEVVVEKCIHIKAAELVFHSADISEHGNPDDALQKHTRRVHNKSIR